MPNHPPRISLRAVVGLTVSLGFVGCSLDDYHVQIMAGAGGAGGGSVTTTGGTTTAGTTTAGSTTAATTTSTTSAGGGGAATTTTVGAGGNMGGAGGEGGDAGGMGGGGGVVPPVKMPTGIAVNGANPTFLAPTGSTGGVVFAQTCQPNEAIVGFDGTMDLAMDSATPWLKSARAFCSSLTLQGTGPFTIAYAVGEILGPLGGPSDFMQMAPCPADQVAVGFAGKSGSFIDQLYPLCAPLTVQGNATDGYTIAIGNYSSSANQIGGIGGNQFTDILCNPGEIVTGWTGRSGSWFDAFGLLCGPVTLTGMVP